MSRISCTVVTGFLAPIASLPPSWRMKARSWCHSTRTPVRLPGRAPVRRRPCDPRALDGAAASWTPRLAPAALRLQPAALDRDPPVAARHGDDVTQAAMQPPALARVQGGGLPQRMQA